jgi:hypothetical protein
VNNTLLVLWKDRVTDEILLDCYSKTRLLLAPDSRCKAIQDFSGVTAFDVSTETLERLASMPSAISIESLHVIVAPKDLVFGVSRMFSVLGEKTRPNLRVVRSMAEAYDLLGIVQPQFSPISLT